MALVLASREETNGFLGYVESGVPSDLGIAFTYAVLGSNPTSLLKWNMQIVKTNVFVSGLEFDIQYNNAGLLLNGMTIQLPAEWQKLLPEINIPDEGDTILSAPGAGMMMSSDTVGTSCSAALMLISGNYYIKLTSGTNVTAKRFKASLRWANFINYTTS